MLYIVVFVSEYWRGYSERVTIVFVYIFVIMNEAQLKCCSKIKLTVYKGFWGDSYRRNKNMFEGMEVLL